MNAKFWVLSPPLIAISVWFFSVFFLICLNYVANRSKGGKNDDNFKHQLLICCRLFITSCSVGSSINSHANSI